MSERTTFDFVVIGAGIAGAGVADALAPHGQVALVEMEDRPGYHATGRSATLFAPSYGPPVVRLLTVASTAFYQGAAGGFTEYPVMSDCGVLYIARDDQRTPFEAEAARLKTDPDVRAMGPQEAQALVPLLRPGYVAAALFDQGSKTLDADAILQGYLRRAGRRGMRLFTNAKPSSLRRRHGLWEVAMASGTISAPVVINAAGAWADLIARQAGVAPVGLRALRRTIVQVDPPAGVDVSLWPAVIDIEEQFYVKPNGARLLISPADADEVEPGDAFAEELTVAIGIDRAQAALDLDVRRISHSWAGLRTFAPDGEPVIGFDLEHEGFFWCAGQGGYGIQSSPASARLAAALAMGNAVPEDLAQTGVMTRDVSPSRFRV